MKACAVVMQDQFYPGRWLVCRKNETGWATVHTDCPTEGSAEEERKKLQRQIDFEHNVKPFVPGEFRQIPLGFYTDDDAA